MALHKDFLQSPHAILDPGLRWFSADEVLCETNCLRNMTMRPFVYANCD